MLERLLPAAEDALAGGLLFGEVVFDGELFGELLADGELLHAAAAMATPASTAPACSIREHFLDGREDMPPRRFAVSWPARAASLFIFSGMWFMPTFSFIVSQVLNAFE